MFESSLLTFILPFIFVLAIVFGALEVSGVLKNKKVNILIAITLAFFAISSEPAVELIYKFLPYASIFFIIVFFIGFILSPFRRKESKGPDYILIVIVAGLLLISLTQFESDLINTFLPKFGIDTQNFLVIAGLILIIIIFYTVYRAEQK